jgi:hypothetical protein
MAAGAQSGEFSLKMTSIIFIPGPANGVLVQASYEGTATGFGTLMLTGTYTGFTSGTHSWCGAAYLDDGNVITYNGQGTHESSGRQKWRTQGVSFNSDGRTLNVEGAIDLAARTWSGKFSEKS